jgi:SpoVK/Ycf46/Vps4 family AAA+-type ATPase
MSVSRKRKINHSENEDDTYNSDSSNDNISCNSKSCDHVNKKIKIDIHEIKNINDLIELGKKYNCIGNREYNGINLRVINNLIEPLIELNQLIGLHDVKNKIIDNCLYIARGYNSVKCNSCIDCKLNIACTSNSKEMLHTVITGPPGVGKTQLARILTKIYSKLGIIKNDKIIEVSRKDLISGYLGRTAKKTQKIFDNANNGVLFIDEAYSLGNTGNEDNYSKECIDIINKNLSENRDTIVIIAGYEKEINECFFRINPGLERRFPFKYNINGYNGEELFEILKYKIKKDNWILSEEESIKLKKYIILNINKFPNYGGDMETILMQAKIKNSRNINSKNYVLKYDDFILG